MSHGAIPPRLDGPWRSTATGVAHAPQQPAELRRARRQAVPLIVLACLLAASAVVMCGIAVSHWGDEYLWMSDRSGDSARYRPITVFGIGLLLLVPAVFSTAAVRVLRRPRKPTVELTPTVVRSNMSGVVEVPWQDVLGARVTNGLHLDLARPVADYRIAGGRRRGDEATSLRLYAPAGELLPLVMWLRDRPASRATVLAPWSDQLAVRSGEGEA
ncbi:hypothetical protein [Streptomyces sp. NPDC006510]|uniref:hypothetical protein n=1 Tax=Streptomyces sp. NPDC006510 TaxID=3155600 RepID=UPI0033A680A7